MKTKNIDTQKITAKVNKAVDTAKKSLNKANEFALNTTEEVVTETITIASQWQKVTEKALKGGVQLLENQQNLIFDTLETYKAYIIKGKKRFHKVITS
jgi:hypothetical protein